MENGEDEGVNKPVSAFDAMRKRFEQQEKTAEKPTVTPKPHVGKLGGGGELNIFAPKKTDDSTPKPGLSKPGNIGKFKPEPVNLRDKSPNTQEGPVKKRNSSVSIPSVFTQNQDSPVPPVKPKPKIEPRSKSDANNNPNLGNIVSPEVNNKPKISAMKPETKYGPSKVGNTSPRDGPPISPRGGQVSAIANALTGISPGDLKRNLRPVKKPTDNATETPKQASVNKEDKEESSSAIELRKKFEKFGGGSFSNKRKSVKYVIRTADDKKFRKVENCFENSGETPTKPEKIDVVLDIDNLIEEFQKQVKGLQSGSGELGVTEIEEEEEYDDVANYQRKESRVVSLIQPMTEADELDEDEWKAAGFAGLDDKEEFDFPPPPLPEDLYDEGFSPTPAAEDDELYEPLPDDEPESAPPLAPKPKSESSEPPPVPELKTRKASETEAAKESKESEKERKKREKEEKEKKDREEKALKKKEKEKERELKALLSSYSITAEELMKSEGKGKIKKTAKASNKKCLAVQEGDKVDIIRMQNKGARGKWLVRLDTTEKVGYVDADNIEVDTDQIRSLMVNKGDNISASAPGDDQEVYEAVDGEDEMNGYEEDEIYEECN